MEVARNVHRSRAEPMFAQGSRSALLACRLAQEPTRSNGARGEATTCRMGRQWCQLACTAALRWRVEVLYSAFDQSIQHPALRCFILSRHSASLVAARANNRLNTWMPSIPPPTCWAVVLLTFSVELVAPYFWCSAHSWRLPLHFTANEIPTTAIEAQREARMQLRWWSQKRQVDEQPFFGNRIGCLRRRLHILLRIAADSMVMMNACGNGIGPLSIPF